VTRTISGQSIDKTIGNNFLSHANDSLSLVPFSVEHLHVLPTIKSQTGHCSANNNRVGRYQAKADVRLFAHS
jgi:hypothetical protein